MPSDEQDDGDADRFPLEYENFSSDKTVYDDLKVFFKKYVLGVIEHREIHKQRSTRIVNLLMDAGTGSNADHALQLMNSSINGLAGEEAERRLHEYGKNEIAREKPPAWWKQLIGAFINPFSIILILLAIASFFTDVFLAEQEDWTRIIILSIMVSVSGTLRFWQEFKSQREAVKLQAMVQNMALVSRPGSNGEEQDAQKKNADKREVPVSDIVPGDIVYLSAGDIVPADVYVISSQDFFVSQSALTGESAPVEKFSRQKVRELKGRGSPLELETLCFMGTTVVSGSAICLAIATGDQTYFGSIAQKVTDSRPITSFDKGINSVSWTLIKFMLVMVPVVFLLNFYTKGDVNSAVFFALAVAVGLTPEMLPLVVTANLAKGAVKMSKKKVVVKKLNAIQNFGSMDILCTDKTGTLTENRIVLVRHLDPKGVESKKALDLAYLNSTFQTGLRSLMDQAIIEKKEKMNDKEEKFSKVDEIPFDFSRRRMGVVIENESERIVICKGAVEEILGICTQAEIDGEIVPMSEGLTEEVKRLTREINAEGLRAIAVAYKNVAKESRVYDVKDECNMILSGYIGFLDPPKPSAKNAIRLLEGHGIKVKVITGDNEIVTARICKEVGLNSAKTLLGSEVGKMSDEELERATRETDIFAKIDPIQKARIVEALRRQGHTVGYLGDGINDAAALRSADVGISVDNGVDIAKEAADIILLENDLLVLEEGVLEGRNVFGNIMKYIKMTVSSNFGNVFSIIAASAFLPFLPMLPIQLLIQNLLYDMSQLSIPWDRMDKEFLRIPRRWEAKGIAQFMVCIGPISSLFDIMTFLLMWYVFGASLPTHQSLFQSGWFVEGLLSQTLIVHMIRTEKIPFVQSRASKPVIILTSTIMAIGVALPFTIIGASIGLQPLPLEYFPYLALILLGYAILTQLIKMLYIRKFKTWL